MAEMVAYSFKAQFAQPILDKTKRQTIRAVGKRRHAAPGGPLELYTGMRTRSCRLIGRATCTSIAAVRLTLDYGWVEFPETGRALTTMEALDRFAQQDGFADWRAMLQFWRREHGPDLVRWEGLLIQWSDTLQVSE